MVGASLNVAPPGLGNLMMLISGGLHPRLHDVAALRLEKRNFKTHTSGYIVPLAIARQHHRTAMQQEPKGNSMRWLWSAKAIQCHIGFGMVGEIFVSLFLNPNHLKIARRTEIRWRRKGKGLRIFSFRDCGDSAQFDVFPVDGSSRVCSTFCVI
jgi:hypothetical protein